MFTPSLTMVQGVALLIWLLTLQCGGVARQGTQGTHDCLIVEEVSNQIKVQGDAKYKGYESNLNY